jgi:DNA-binding response OmpR family regulator
VLFESCPDGPALLIQTGELLPGRILVVDDELAIRQLLTDLFVSEGYLVSQAANGEQALRELQLVEPNIVVIDLMMPVMSGLEFVAKCRQVPGCSALPIILMSAAYGAGRTAPRLLGTDIKVNAYLSKPFEIAELLALVALHTRLA